MALGNTIRNRIVGLLVIVSVVLIALPAMMDNDRVKRQENNEAIAIDKNGAIIDSDGDLMPNIPRDYATLLDDPKADVLESDLPSLNNKNTAINSKSGSIDNNSYTHEAIQDGTSGEILIGAVSTVDNANKNSDNKTLSNVKTEDKGATLNTKGYNKPEVLGSKPQVLGTAKKNVNTSTTQNTQKQVTTSDLKVLSGKYSVQVGVFSQMENASRLVIKLKNAGIKAYSQKVSINGKNMVRVYAGSGNSKESLQKTLVKVQEVTGSKASIVKVQ